MHQHFRRARLALAILGLAGISSAVAEDKPYQPDQVAYSMFYLADIRDSPECAAHVAGGTLGFADTITNPAMSCPDAFAWKLFVETVSQGFWENWSSNRQTWPSDPWPRCAPGQSGNCCPSVVTSNEIWPEHCPVFPGATPGAPDHIVGEPSKAHQIDLAVAAVGDKDGDGIGEWEDVPAILKNAVIGAIQNELIYRNGPMVDYIFSRDLYHQDGLARVYDSFVRAFSAYAPRWPKPDDPVATPETPPALAEINFPVKAVMVKVNWLPVEEAERYGIDPNDQANPFIMMDLVPQSDTNKPPAGTVVKKPFILLSLHISSKDLPNWFWASFEHVANQGRCDWLGCNDSFGYINTETAKINPGPAAGLAEPAHNFTPPHSVSKVDGAGQDAFTIADRYVGVDRVGDELDALLKAFDIGSAEGTNTSGLPTVQDKAWRSYRLKGSQTNFVTSTGRPTRLGNSVTEAGFVNTASCITCHARAGATKAGVPPLSIFADTLSDAGIPESVLGMPVEAWFDVNAYWGLQGQREAPGILAVQTDFVWGFRNACPMERRTLGPSWCTNVVSGK